MRPEWHVMLSILSEEEEVSNIPCMEGSFWDKDVKSWEGGYTVHIYPPPAYQVVLRVSRNLSHIREALASNV